MYNWSRVTQPAFMAKQGSYYLFIYLSVCRSGWLFVCLFNTIYNLSFSLELKADYAGWVSTTDRMACSVNSAKGIRVVEPTMHLKSELKQSVLTWHNKWRKIYVIYISNSQQSLFVQIIKQTKTWQISQAIKNMKKNKAPAMDELTAMYDKYFEEVLVVPVQKNGEWDNRRKDYNSNIARCIYNVNISSRHWWNVTTVISTYLSPEHRL